MKPPRKSPLREAVETQNRKIRNERNQVKGSLSEGAAEIRMGVRNLTYERTGTGSDYRISGRDAMTGRIYDGALMERKSNENASLSPAQRRTKKETLERGGTYIEYKGQSWKEYRKKK